MYEIVLVTDSPWVEEDVVAELDHDEFELRVARDAAEALRLTRERRPTAVVCDMQVGNMGGPALCAELRNDLDDRIATTPVVCLLDRAADAWVCKKLGAQHVLVKPFEPGSLEKVLRQFARELSGRPSRS